MGKDIIRDIPCRICDICGWLCLITEMKQYLKIDKATKNIVWVNICTKHPKRLLIKGKYF